MIARGNCVSSEAITAFSGEDNAVNTYTENGEIDKRQEILDYHDVRDKEGTLLDASTLNKLNDI